MAVGINCRFDGGCGGVFARWEQFDYARSCNRKKLEYGQRVVKSFRHIGFFGRRGIFNIDFKI